MKVGLTTLLLPSHLCNILCSWHWYVSSIEVDYHMTTGHIGLSETRVVRTDPHISHRCDTLGMGEENWHTDCSRNQVHAHYPLEHYYRIYKGIDMLYRMASKIRCKITSEMERF